MTPGINRIKTWILIAALGGLFVLIKGSPSEQAQQAVGVFLASLAAGDTQTAHELLCEAERARIPEAGVAPEYGVRGKGQVTGSQEVVSHGRQVQQVDVRYSDGTTSVLVVVLEDGPRICGTAH